MAHADELFYMFSPFFNQNIVLNEDDQKMSGIILSLWKNFIKTGEPSTGKIIWDPVLDAASRQYFNLNLNSSMEVSDDVTSNMNFWKDIVTKLEEVNTKQAVPQKQNESNCNLAFPKNVLFALIITILNVLK